MGSFLALMVNLVKHYSVNTIHWLVFQATLALVDTAYSGDWSRIGAITKGS